MDEFFDDNELKRGDVQFTGKNPKESLEGSHSLLVGAIDALMHLEHEEMIITDIELKATFKKDEVLKEVTITGKANNINGIEIFFDTLSLDRMKNFDGFSENSKELYQYIEDSLWTWMGMDEWKVFVNKFMELYKNVYGEDSLNELEPLEEGEFWDCDDINKLLLHISPHYLTRHCAGLGKGFQLQYSDYLDNPEYKYDGGI